MKKNLFYFFVLFLILGCSSAVRVKKDAEEPKRVDVVAPVVTAAPAEKVPEGGALASKKTEASLRDSYALDEIKPGSTGGEGTKSRSLGLEKYGASGGPASALGRVAAQSPAVKAGSHDDNEEFAYYRQFVEKYKDLQNVIRRDTGERYIFRLIDEEGFPVPFAGLKLVSNNGKEIWQGLTYANGEALFFPGVTGNWPNETGGAKNNENPPQSPFDKGGKQGGFISENFSGEIIANVKNAEQKFPFIKTQDGIIELKIQGKRTVTQPVKINVVFLLDTTGSMGDEIDRLKDVLYSIHSRIVRFPEQPMVKFGMVLYRDRGDKYLTEVTQLTDNVDSFQLSLNRVTADGGGDTPEDLQAGLDKTLTEIKWEDNAIKIVFLLADAVPHLDYKDEEGKDYTWAMEKARKDGIKICSIGASGLPAEGEYIFRQLALNTYGQFVFLTYGETGESEGRETKADPGKVSHHTGSNYQVKSLDDIVVDIVKRDFSNLIAKESVVHIKVEPEAEKDLLEVRVDNLLQQVLSQVKESVKKYDEQVAFISMIDCPEKELEPLSGYIKDLSYQLILKNKWMKLVEREKLDKVLKEIELGMTGVVDAEKAVKAGKMLSANLFLSGKLYYLAQDRVLFYQVVDVETAQVIAAARVRM